MSKITIAEVNNRIETHEAVCAQRMSELLSRVKRLESIILASAGAIIILLASLFFK